MMLLVQQQHIRNGSANDQRQNMSMHTSRAWVVFELISIILIKVPTLPKSSDFDSVANNENIPQVAILQKHIREICSIKCPYSGGNGVGCHWHLSAWCSRWWSPTGLPSGHPCPWLESPLGTVLCSLDPCWAALSWWYLWMRNWNSEVEGEAWTVFYGIIYLCKQM